MLVEIDSAGLSRVKWLFSDIKNGAEKVLTKSINKTLTSTRVQAVARIGNELTLPAKRIKKDFYISKAKYKKLSGKLVASGAPVGLIQFGATQRKMGISVKVLRKNRRKVVKHTFIAKGRGASISKDDDSVKQHMYMREYLWKGGAPGVKFLRGKKYPNVAWGRMPEKFSFQVRRLTGPRIEDIFAKKRVIEPVTIQANKLFADTIANQIDEMFRRQNL